MRPDPARKGDESRPAKPKRRKETAPVEESAGDTPRTGSGWKWFSLALLLGLVLGIGAAVLVFFPRKDKAAEETEPALAHLRDSQRGWWEQEFGGAGIPDPDVAREKLAAVQREWWDSEGLGGEGDDEAAALTQLEELQRAWWESEGFELGKKPSDARGALSRLEKVNRQWWDSAKPRRVTAHADGEEDTASGASPEEVSVQLKDQAGTRAFLTAGGSEESEKAVQLGLAWIASQQRPDGRWSFVAEKQKPPPNHPDTAATSMALLPFLARGYTHKVGSTPNPYAKQVEVGLQYLVKQQKPDGDLRAGGNLYTHALAAMALCEAFNMTSDHSLREPAQRAVNFTIAAQSPSGGWRYVPRQGADLSVTSWNLMALKSGQMAGFRVPDNTLTKANRYLQSLRKPNGAYWYAQGQPGHSPPAPGPMTAAGIVCRHYLQHHDASDKSSRMDGIDIILKRPPDAKRPNFYYFYYSMYALFPIGGDPWKSWNPQVRDLVVSLQNKGEKNARAKGSWDPRGGTQIDRAGRLAVTSMALLTLEVYYRHLPLNQPELGQMTKENLGPKKK